MFQHLISIYFQRQMELNWFLANAQRESCSYLKSPFSFVILGC